MGNLFDPVADQQFDLIISNPPFIVGPNSDLTYRDNKLDLDDFCRNLAREAAEHLKNGGSLQMLCEWVEVNGQTGRDRILQWVEGLGCDTWALRGNVQRPRSYVTKRMADISGPEVASSTGFDEWLEYLESRDVQAIHTGMLVLRRRETGGWFQCSARRSCPKKTLARLSRRTWPSATSWNSVRTDESLLEATLKVSDHAELHQSSNRKDGTWESDRILVRLTGRPAARDRN